MNKIILLFSVIIIYPIHAWCGNLQLSVRDTQGNNRTQTISVDGENTFKQERTEQRIKAGIFYSEDDSTRNAENWYANIKNNHFLTDFLYDYALNGLEVDEFAGYDLRLAASVGVGIKGQWDGLEGYIESGPGYIYEETIDGTDASYIVMRAYEELSWELEDKVTLIETCEYLYDYENDQNYRVNGSVGVVVKATDSFSMKAGPEVKYVNMPVDGMERTDIITKATIIWSF